jgi:chorismate synthase
VILPRDQWENNTNIKGKGSWARKTNNAGGVEGGMSNGEPVVINAIVKPIATIINGLQTVDLHTGEFVDKAHFERSDITFVPTCAVIGEAMVACVIAESMLEKFGGDHLEETKRNYHSYLDTIVP